MSSSKARRSNKRSRTKAKVKQKTDRKLNQLQLIQKRKRLTPDRKARKSYK